MTIPASPRAKVIASELGIDLAEVASLNGRIRSRDVLRHVTDERSDSGEHRVAVRLKLEAACHLLDALRSNERTPPPAPKIGDLFACCVSVALDAAAGLVRNRELGAITLTTPVRWRRLNVELQSLRDIAAQLDGLESTRWPSPQAGQPATLVVDTHRWGVSALEIARPVGVQLILCLETPLFEYAANDPGVYPEPSAHAWEGLEGKIHLTVASSLDIRLARRFLSEIQRLMEDPSWMLSL